jgi:hypothetical protein
MQKVKECKDEIVILKEKYKGAMIMIMTYLRKYTKKGVYSYLDEAFTRINFNNFYVSRDREGLD